MLKLLDPNFHKFIVAETEYLGCENQGLRTLVDRKDELGFGKVDISVKDFSEEELMTRTDGDS